MARKNYSGEFRRQAVDLYESTPWGPSGRRPTTHSHSRSTPPEREVLQDQRSSPVELTCRGQDFR